MRLVRAMVLTLCELLAAVSHQLPTVSRGIGARDRWILPNLHLHAIRAALVVPTQEQGDYSSVKVGGPFKTTLIEL